jgi:aryl-alcohol dehydrogenase-like predicted oxidoreductase
VWKPNGRPERLREGLEGSLRRLKLDRIDLFQLHRVDPAVPADEQFGFLQSSQREGLIRHIGLSEVTIEQIEGASRFFPVVSVQNRYNLEEREWEPVLDYCDREGIAFIPWYPLKVGRIGETGGAVPKVARAHGATPSQVALAWLLQRSPVMLPIPGTSRRTHLDENMGAAALRLTEEELKALG